MVKLISDVSELATGYGNYHSAAGPQPPTGHFVILPSANCSLLIKSLAVSELMMPADFPPVDQQSQDCLDNMSAVLDKVCSHSVHTLRYIFASLCLRPPPIGPSACGRPSIRVSTSKLCARRVISSYDNSTCTV